jgi:hypothetical protein
VAQRREELRQALGLVDDERAGVGFEEPLDVREDPAG